VVFVEIDVKEIKRVVSERLGELDRDFVEMRKRGERFTSDFFISRIALAVEGTVKDFLKRILGGEVTCDKALWLLPEGRAKLVVNCLVPGERRVLVTMDPGLVSTIDLKLGDVVYWVPLRKWSVDVKVY
jgi:hypothetical protein